MATVTNTNGISRSGSGNGPRTRIINLNKSNMTEAELREKLIRENKEEYMLNRNDAHPNAKAHKFYADKILDKIHE